MTIQHLPATGPLSSNSIAAINHHPHCHVLPLTAMDNDPAPLSPTQALQELHSRPQTPSHIQPKNRSHSRPLCQWQLGNYILLSHPLTSISPPGSFAPPHCMSRALSHFFLPSRFLCAITLLIIHILSLPHAHYLARKFVCIQLFWVISILILQDQVHLFGSYIIWLGDLYVFNCFGYFLFKDYRSGL